MNGKCCRGYMHGHGKTKLVYKPHNCEKLIIQPIVTDREYSRISELVGQR